MDTSLLSSLGYVAFPLAPVFLLAVLGLLRMQRREEVLRSDWQLLAEFGAALRALIQSAGHDAKALAALIVLAPDVEPLVFGFHRDAPRLAAEPAQAAPAVRTPQPRALSPEALFADLGSLPHAFEDPPTSVDAHPQKDRLANLQGQILGAEWLLQTEMKRLARGESSLPAWLFEGVAGILLVFATPVGGPATSTRTRRRMLESDPRFARLVWAVLMLVAALSFTAVVVGVAGLVAHVRAAARP